MNEQEILAWGRDLEARKAWVLHETLAVGPVRKFWDGEAERYVSPVNDLEVKAPVLELETGHALVANPDAFLELTTAEFRMYAALQQGLAGLAAMAARGAASAGVDRVHGIALMRAALRAQLAALELPTKDPG